MDDVTSLVLTSKAVDAAEKVLEMEVRGATMGDIVEKLIERVGW